VALFFVTVIVMLPVVAIVANALQDGVVAYARAILDGESLAALRLTLCTAAVVVPANTVFGLTAGWAIGNFDFPGKTLLTALIEVPIAVSPVISGLVFCLCIGPRTALGSWLVGHGIRVLFAGPGIFLATGFVTFGYVARQVITAMQTMGREKEEAAIVLGAGGWQTFSRVTLPSIRWGVLYGVILCNARAMGEFGAVSVVSGHIRGATNTLPLQVEMLYDDYRISAAFAVASVLLFLAVVTLAAKVMVGTKLKVHA
jgi:sulfate transport system permease protein